MFIVNHLPLDLADDLFRVEPSARENSLADIRPANAEVFAPLVLARAPRSEVFRHGIIRHQEASVDDLRQGWGGDGYSSSSVRLLERT